MSIRKVCSFYWGGQPLSWLRYMTILSFKFQNPDWKINLYVPKVVKNHTTWNTGEQSGKYEGKDWLHEVKSYCNEVITFDMETVGHSNDLPEVHKSDIIRNHILSTSGGLWSDMDILYFKPVPESLLEKDFICHKGVDFSIGFIGAQENSPLYQMFFNLQKKIYNQDYQAFGNALFYKQNIDVLHRLYDFNNISMEFVYHFSCDNIPKIFEKGELPNESFALHWFGGSPITREWENVLNPATYEKFDNVLCDKLKEVLQ